MKYKCPHCPLFSEFGSPILAHIIKEHRDQPEVTVAELMAESLRLARRLDREAVPVS